MEDNEQKEIVDDGRRFLALEKNSKNYQFLFYKDSPVGEIYDVLSDMRKFVFKKIYEDNQDKPAEELKNE